MQVLDCIIAEDHSLQSTIIFAPWHKDFVGSGKADRLTGTISEVKPMDQADISVTRKEL